VPTGVFKPTTIVVVFVAALKVNQEGVAITVFEAFNTSNVYVRVQPVTTA
jgi:hypothetical protein